MRFKYLGENKGMKVFGYDFSGGKTPDVTDEKVIKKLSGNREFAMVEGGAAGPPPGGERTLPLGDGAGGADPGGEGGGEEDKAGKDRKK